MFIEFLIIIGTLFLIAVFFYKQSIQEYRILQINEIVVASSMPMQGSSIQTWTHKIPILIQEKCPIVITDIDRMVGLWTRADIAAAPRLGSLALEYPNTDPFALATMDKWVLPTRPSNTAYQIAEESGLQVWAEHHILEPFKLSKEGEWKYLSPVSSIRTQALVGSQGLRQTTAYITIIFPTEGEIMLTLIHSGMAKFCPKEWHYTDPKKWTTSDCPQVGQLKYMDIIVRPQTALVVPPHWRVSWTSLDQKSDVPPPVHPLVVWVEIHHPISKLASWLINTS